jgi:hypothetical protein
MVVEVCADRETGTARLQEAENKNEQGLSGTDSNAKHDPAYPF